MLKNSLPLFSIVIANYNHGAFLENAIKSVLSQNCDDYELIVVDGGSTDNSVEIISKYKTELAWWVSENDNGQSDAFNKGFHKAKGKYLFWINADDFLLQGSIKIAKEYVMRYPKSKWFAANTIYIDNHGNTVKCVRGLKWSDMLVKNAPIYVYGPTSIFSRELFQSVGGFDESLHYTMDTDLWMRFHQLGVKFIRIPKYFWAFRIHDDSKTSASLVGKPSENHLNERQAISIKNNHIYNSLGILRQRFFKTIYGSYLLSYLDTRKYKGKQLSQTKFL